MTTLRELLSADDRKRLEEIAAAAEPEGDAETPSGSVGQSGL